MTHSFKMRYGASTMSPPTGKCRIGAGPSVTASRSVSRDRPDGRGAPSQRDAGLSGDLLGGRPPVLARAAAGMVARHPSLRIVGAQHGFFDPASTAGVVSDISASGADILLVGLGTPRQQLFLSANREQLGVSFAMGVGGSFEVISGRRRRAPLFIQRCGFEWAFRAAQEPWRLGHRYGTTSPKFLVMLGWTFLTERLASIRSRVRPPSLVGGYKPQPRVSDLNHEPSGDRNGDGSELVWSQSRRSDPEPRDEGRVD